MLAFFSLAVIVFAIFWTGNQEKATGELDKANLNMEKCFEAQENILEIQQTLIEYITEDKNGYHPIRLLGMTKGK